MVVKPLEQRSNDPAIILGRKYKKTLFSFWGGRSQKSKCSLVGKYFGIFGLSIYFHCLGSHAGVIWLGVRSTSFKTSCSLGTLPRCVANCHQDKLGFSSDCAGYAHPPLLGVAVRGAAGASKSGTLLVSIRKQRLLATDGTPSSED